VSGTDLVDPEPPGPVPDGVPVVWLSPVVEMTAGKAMAQVGHATMLLAAFLDLPALTRWAEAGLPVAVRRADELFWGALADPTQSPATLWDTSRLVAVRDAGFTEVAPGTITVVADGSSLR
jgi:peptidyl-tRNA hydrolase